ncbi:MAG: VanZ family protein [Desulfobacterales bacterium]
MNCKKTLDFKLLICMNLVMLLLIIFFGLFFKGVSLTNQVSWLEKQNGIRFDNYGIAYANTVFPANSGDYEQTGLCFELALRPDNLKNDRFRILLSIHGGVDSEQLLLGQWRSALVVMNGNDYDGSMGTPRIGVLDALSPHQDNFIHITSGSDGTRIYINGKLRQYSARLVLKIPNKTSDAVIVLGNSPYVRHSWTGNIYGLAIYEQVLSEKETVSHYNKWSKANMFSFPRNIHPKVLYAFDDKSGQMAVDHSRNLHHLVIPSRVEILKKEILVAPWNEKRLDPQLMQDMVINLAGFIPPGFFFYALLVNLGGWAEKKGFLLVFFTCFMISLTIELVQVLIPSRSSQSLDLIMNTIGGLLGAVFYNLKQIVLQKI